MIIIKNTQRTVPIDVKRLHTDAEIMLKALDYEGYDLSIWFTTNKTVREYNKQYRNIDKATDILSFPFHNLKPGERIQASSEDERNIGDLLISASYVHDLYPGDAFYPRLQKLLAHGISHLLGHDHDTPSTDAIMIDQEEFLLDQLT